VVVVGDSTAAGLGNRRLVGGNARDRACHRSQDAFAVVLASANDWQVTNLACSGATIRAGLLGPQQVGDRTVPAQLDTRAVAKADLIVVSIGANDVNWSLILQLCAVSPDCGSQAEQAYFQQQLAGFSRDLLQVLSQLQLLDNHPVVIVNQYYDPFSGDTSCLTSHGLTQAKKDTLESELSALNHILGQGAETAGFRVARPDFSGHGVCSDQPYVQGLHAAAPFHPTASGELAIALADERALRAQPGS
jgi:lysophospholipase L1-like esterase